MTKTVKCFFFIWINENQSDNAIDIIIVIRFDDTFFILQDKLYEWINAHIK